MIIADKILSLRKKHGYSQEELAEMLNVSRQSVSKWESRTSVPDIGKIVEMSKIFSVSTDYLLKDELEVPDCMNETEDAPIRKISLEEANEFITASRAYGKENALAISLCILSPVALFLLSEKSPWRRISENSADAIGLIILFVFISLAVAIFIYADSKMKQYDYLKKEDFTLEYGVFGIIKQKKAEALPSSTKTIILCVVLYILAPLPLMVAGALEIADYLSTYALCILLILVAISTYLLCNSETEKESFDVILCEGEYRKNKKERKTSEHKIGGIYWPIIVAVYLGWSLATHDWGFTWIIWPIAALIFSSICAIFDKSDS